MPDVLYRELVNEYNFEYRKNIAYHNAKKYFV